MNPSSLGFIIQISVFLAILMIYTKSTNAMPDTHGGCTFTKNLQINVQTHSRLTQQIIVNDQLHHLQISYEVIEKYIKQTKQDFVIQAFKVSANYFRRIIKVTQIAAVDKLYQINDRCGGKQVNLKYKSVDNFPFRDIMIFLVFKDDNFSKAEGSSQICMIKKRPIYGAMYLNMARLPSLLTDDSFSKIVNIIMHHTIHILGFNSALFQYFDQNVETNQTSPYDKNRQMITTPNVFVWVQQYFNCKNSSLGALLQNDGLASIKNQHWQRAVFYDQMMTGDSNNRSYRLTGLTLSLLKDTNFYEYINFDYIWQSSYGVNKSCDFAFGLFQKKQIYQQFCDPEQFQPTACDMYNQFLAQCAVQDFLTKSEGVHIPQMIYQCQDTSQHIHPDRVTGFERYDDKSSCFNIIKKNKTVGYCLQSSCNQQDRSILFTINNQEFICKDGDQSISVTTYKFSVICPSFDIFCSAKKCVDWCGKNGVCISSMCLILDCNQEDLQHCQFCSKKQNQPLKCQKCQKGYKIESNKCLLAIQEIGYSQEGWFIKSGDNCDSLEDLACRVGSCPPNCQICQSETVCKTCFKETFKNQITGKCELCPSGMFINSNGQCVFCSNKCIDCEGSQDICTSCASNQGLFHHACYLCLQLQGWFMNPSGNVCQKCNQNCASCQITQNNCTSCYPSYYIQNHICFPCSTSPSKFIDKQGQCKQCDENCYKCKDTSTFCIQCDYWNWLADNNTCVACNFGQYFDSQAKKCLKCSNFCPVCYHNSNDCTKELIINGYAGAQWEFDKVILCQQGCKFCTKDKQILKCHIPMDGYHIQNFIAKACSQHCLTCQSQTLCIQCQQSYTVNNSICLKCHQSCLTCESFNVNKCIKCFNTYHKNQLTGLCQKIEIKNCYRLDQNFKCVECALGYALIQQSNQCFECPYYCPQCNSSNITQCLLCPYGYFMINENCERCINNCLQCQNSFTCNQCITGYYLSDARGCEKICQLPCWKCQNQQLRKCTQCYDGFQLDKNTKSCKPISSTGTLSVCPFGQRLSLGLCVKCSLNQCLQCKSSTIGIQICTYCKPGFYVNESGLCQRCTIGCKLCKNQNICLLCQQRYIMLKSPHQQMLSRHQCLKCQQPCQICLGDVNICQDCIEGYILFGYECITLDFLYYEVTLNTNYQEFLSKRKEVQVIKQLLVQISINFTQRKYHSIYFISEGSVILSGIIKNAEVNSSQICNQQKNLLQALEVGKKIADLQILASTVTSNLTYSYYCETIVYQSSYNILLILLLTIPFAILTCVTLIVVLICLYKNFYKDAPQTLNSQTDFKNQSGHEVRISDSEILTDHPKQPQ